MMKGILENEFTVCDVTPRSGTLCRAAKFHFCHKSIQNIYSQMQHAGVHQLACLLVSIQIGHRFSKEMCIFLSFMEFLISLICGEESCLFVYMLLMMILILIFLVLISNLSLIPIIFVSSYIYLFSSSDQTDE